LEGCHRFVAYIELKVSARYTEGWRKQTEEVKGKVKVRVKFTIEQATKAHRWSRVKLYSFFNLGTIWGWVVNATPRPLYPRERDPVPIV